MLPPARLQIPSKPRDRTNSNCRQEWPCHLLGTRPRNEPATSKTHPRALTRAIARNRTGIAQLCRLAPNQSATTAKAESRALEAQRRMPSNPLATGAGIACPVYPPCVLWKAEVLIPKLHYGYHAFKARRRTPRCFTFPNMWSH